MSEQIWIYELLSEEFGPVSANEIHELVGQGMLADTDRVRQADSQVWITVSEMPAASDQNAGKISDLSELSFSFEENQDASLEQRPEPAAAGLDIDSIDLQGDSDSPLPPSNMSSDTIPPPVEQEPEAVFSVESLGQVLGPMPLRDLIMMADTGAISAADKVREGDGDWQLAENIPALSAAFISAGVQPGGGPTKKASEPTAEQQEKAAATPTTAASPETNASTESSGEELSPPPKPAGKKKKRRKKKKDEALEEIFAEVFTSEGKLRDDLQPATQEQSAEVSKSSAVVGSATPTASPTTVGESVPATEATAAPPSPTPQPAAAAPAMSPPPAQRPWGDSPGQSPPARKKPRRSMNFSMPDPKVLGVIGGVIALGLVIAAFATGMIEFPGFAPDGKTVLQQYTDEYNKLGGENISESDWKDLQKRTREAVVAVNKGLAGGDMSANSLKLRLAITKLGAFVSTPYEDKDARKAALENVRQAIGEM